MESNPFAPPKARVVDSVQDVYGLKRRRVVTMLVFTFLSLGIYYLVWFYRRRSGLNRLNSPRKIALWPLLLLTALFAAQVILGVMAGGAPVNEFLGPGLTVVFQIVQLAVGIVMIVQCFRIKDIIEDHATPDGPQELFVERVKLSGLMTFFFSIFYLQWAINRYVIDGAAHSPNPVPASA